MQIIQKMSVSHPFVLDTGTTWTLKIANPSGNSQRGIVYFVYSG